MESVERAQIGIEADGQPLDRRVQLDNGDRSGQGVRPSSFTVAGCRRTAMPSARPPEALRAPPSELSDRVGAWAQAQGSRDRRSPGSR